MQAPQQQQLNVSPELQQKYMTAKNIYKQVVKTVLALEDEKKEHLWFKQSCHKTDK